MSIVRTCLALILAALSHGVPAHALELGETYEQLLAKHGSATVEDRSRGLVRFTYGEWTVDATMEKGIVHSILYRKLSPIAEAEIPGILQANGGRDAWKPSTTVAGKAGSWTRVDGATASIDPKQPRYLTLQGGRGIYRAPEPAAKPAPPISPAPQPKPPQTAVAVGKPLAPTTNVAPPAAAQPPTTSPEPAPANAEPPKKLDGKTLAAIGIGLVIILIFAAVKLAPKLVLRHRATGTAKGAPPLHFRASPKMTARSPGELGWEQFELLVAEIFRRRGWHVELERALGPDGGVDVRAYREGRRAIIQCKQRSAEKVGAPAVRELLGVMHAEQADEAWFFTTTGYTGEALDFAAGQPVTLVDGPLLEASMREIAVEGENLCDIARWLPALQVQARWREPACPMCRSEMTLRKNSADGSVFWGCRTFPACKGTRDARKDLRHDLAEQTAG